MQKITPFLWFDGKAEEAMKFYVSIFKNSKILSPMTFRLDGQEFFAFNGGPHFTFTPAISLFVNCETQQEVDELWEKLSEGGEKGRCGWLKWKRTISTIFSTASALPPGVLTNMTSFVLGVATCFSGSMKSRKGFAMKGWISP